MKMTKTQFHSLVESMANDILKKKIKAMRMNEASLEKNPEDVWKGEKRLHKDEDLYNQLSDNDDAEPVHLEGHDVTSKDVTVAIKESWNKNLKRFINESKISRKGLKRLIAETYKRI